MNDFSTNVYQELLKTFPDWENIISLSSEFLELDVSASNNALIGGLVIQTTEDNSIWIRNYHPFSGNSCDTIQEMIKVILGVLSDQILWVTGFKSDEWFETTLINEINDLQTEKGIRYQILSWSGKFDKVVSN